MFGFSELMRKKFASELGNQKSNNYEIVNEINQLQVNKKLSQISMVLLHDKMVTLYDSIKEMSSTQKLEESY